MHHKYMNRPETFLGPVCSALNDNSENWDQQITSVPSGTQELWDCKQKAGTPERKCPSSGQNRNPSVVFLWSNEKSPQFSLRRFPALEHRNTIDAGILS